MVLALFFFVPDQGGGVGWAARRRAPPAGVLKSGRSASERPSLEGSGNQGRITLFQFRRPWNRVPVNRELGNSNLNDTLLYFSGIMLNSFSTHRCSFLGQAEASDILHDNSVLSHRVGYSHQVGFSFS
jgi:hypothetical protein